MRHSSAGANWGSQFIPRVGQEVLVDFIEGDIDRPVVVGLAHNGRHMPATFSGAGTLPANKTLSGIKSKEYKGNLYNELLFGRVQTIPNRVARLRVKPYGSAQSSGSSSLR